MLGLYNILFSLLSIFFAWEFSVTINDIVDVHIDKLSNKKRPLITGSLSTLELYYISGFYILFSILSAAFVGQRFTFIILVFTAIYWLYSVPPSRLKRIPFLATALIAIACVALIYGGILVTGRQPDAMPLNVAVAVLVSFTLAFNVKDLKDYEGDSREKIRTLMTIFGPHRGRRITAGLALVAYILFPVILGTHTLAIILTSAVFGVATAVAVLKNAGEKIVFALYFAYFAVMALAFGDIIKTIVFG